MALPWKILNRLRMGRDLAARLPPSRVENLAWVYVDPLLNRANGVYVPQLSRIVAFGEENPIAGFLVRHLELPAQVAQDYYEDWRDDIGQALFDERVIAANEEELEAILRRWITDFSILRVPSIVGYRFERGPQLLP